MFILELVYTTQWLDVLVTSWRPAVVKVGILIMEVLLGVELGVCWIKNELSIDSAPQVLL